MSEDKAIKHEEWIARYGGELPTGVALEEEIVAQRGRAPAGVLLEEKIKRSKKGVSSYEVIFANEIKSMIFDGKAFRMAIVNSLPPIIVFIFAIGLVIAYGLMVGTLPPPTAPLWRNMLNDIAEYMIQLQYLFLIIPSTLMSTNWFSRDLRSGKLALVFSNPIDRISFLAGKILGAAISFTVVGIVPLLIGL
ncbi:MAG: ABC transporter permease subunit, partial [Candidatus Korarchaeota archaeon]